MNNDVEGGNNSKWYIVVYLIYISKNKLRWNLRDNHESRVSVIKKN